MGVRCPECGSESAYWWDASLDSATTAPLRFVCFACGEEFEEWYGG